MYTPKYFVENDLEKIYHLIEKYSFGTLICTTSSGDLEIAHLPFILTRTEGGLGVLRGHVARANPIWQMFSEAQNLVAVFEGPHGYITPRWYFDRAEVPTWNYTAVHVYGEPQLLVKSQLKRLLGELVDKYEKDARDKWQISEVPELLYERMLEEIVGFEIRIREFKGKFKLNQNRIEVDREGVIKGLRKRGEIFDSELAEWMTETLSANRAGF
jgi:transcriptional regulator